MKENSIRLFIAAQLPQELVRFLMEQVAEVSPTDWRLVPEQNLHLTQLFIGNVAETRQAEILEKLATIARQQRPFSLSLKEISGGPNSRSPRLIWAAFHPSAQFEALAKQLQLQLAPEVKLPKQLIPHITLARKRKEIAVPEIPAFPALQNTVDLPVMEISLWKSVLGTPHPAYSVLASFMLANHAN